MPERAEFIDSLLSLLNEFAAGSDGNTLMDFMQWLDEEQAKPPQQVDKS